jgi:hypothetical protein
LEKLFGARSFGDFIDLLIHRQATLLASLNGITLLYVVRIATLTFLGCWALITFAFVTRF